MHRNLYVQLDITTKCNLQCVMCARKQEIVSGYDISLDSFRVIAERIFDRAAILNLACGSEPLMSNHFEKIVEIVKPFRIPRVEFISNGLLLNEKRLRCIIEGGVTAFEISLDGAVKQTYERIRKGSKFERVIENIEKLNTLKTEYKTKFPHLMLSFVMMNSNIRELPRFVELASQLNASEVIARHVVVFKGSGMETETLYDFQGLSDAMVLEAQRIARRRGILFQGPPLFNQDGGLPAHLQSRFRLVIDTLRSYGITRISWLVRKLLRRKLKIGRVRCYRPWEYILINPDGNVLPCGVWYDEEPMGNILEQSFDDIWHGEKYVRLRDELRGNRPLRSVCAFCPSVASKRLDPNAFKPVD